MDDEQARQPIKLSLFCFEYMRRYRFFRICMKNLSDKTNQETQRSTRISSFDSYADFNFRAESTVGMEYGRERERDRERERTITSQPVELQRSVLSYELELTSRRERFSV